MPRLGVGLGLGLRQAVSGGGGFDPDASAFFARVTAAGGTLTATEQTATNSLVVQMKADGIWTSMKAIYPMVGASAAACAQNLKSSSFTGTFSSGFTFSNTGVTPNGTSSFMNTNFLLGSSNGFNYNNMHFAHYSRTNSLGGVQVDMGAGAAGFNNLYQEIAGNSGGTLMSKQLDSSTANSFGFLIKTAISTTNAKLYKNGNLTFTNTTLQTATTDINLNCSIFAQNTAQVSSRQCAFASIGDGLLDAQASNFYTAVQTFNQTLNRQVGAQIVSDADAQAYVDRVYTAGGSLTNTEANAVNQLTIDMKAANIWTAMKAVYPMVGSSAAACAQNLKSSSFTGTFTSGWTFASTGVTGNGTSAYFDTTFKPGTDASLSGLSFGGYLRLNLSSPLQVDGIGTSDLTQHNFISANMFSGQLANVLSYTANPSQRMFVHRRTSASFQESYRNGISLGTNTVTSTGLPSINYYIGARNEGSGSQILYTSQQYAFYFFGLSLTNQNAIDLTNAVNTFQTTLSRQV